MNLADAEREMAAFDAHTRARMREAAGDFKAAIQRSLRSPRRTITGRVLRFAWKHEGRIEVCSCNANNTLRGEPGSVNLSERELRERLGPNLVVRLVRSRYGVRCLEHALLVGTRRREPATFVRVRSLASWLDVNPGPITPDNLGADLPWRAWP
jgi:hypothetical protein